MSSISESPIKEKKRVSPILLIVGAILAVSALFMVMPSSQTARVRKAQATLDKEFRGPPISLFSNLEGASMLSGNQIIKFSQKRQGFLYVLTPTPTDTTSATYINQAAYPAFNFRNEGETSMILMAPDPSSTGWSLLAKVWIGEALTNKSRGDISTISSNLSSTPSSAIAQLTKRWGMLDPTTQAQAEAILESNRKLAAQFRGTRRFYIDKGTVYEVNISSSPYSFYDAITQSKR